MARAVRMFHLALCILLLTFASVTAAQKGQGTSTTQPSQPKVLTYPRPDIRMPDISHVQYQEYESKPLTFTSTSVYVLVPVIVTDKNGNHVGGLTRDAFRILENGKERKIASLEEINATATPIPAPAISKDVFTNMPVFANGTNLPAPATVQARRLVILAIDLVNTPYLDQARARQAVISYLADNIDPNALYELVAIDTKGLRLIHDFTQDTPGLIAGLKQVKAKLTTSDKTATESADALRVQMNEKPSAQNNGAATAPVTGSSDPGPGTIKINLQRKDLDLFEAILGNAERPMSEVQAANAAGATLSAFQQIAQRVSGVPGRKSLVWITGGFPFSIDPQTASVDVSISFPVYQHTMHLLANQMISVYPVDARGLLTNQPDAGLHMSARRTIVANSWIMDESARQRDVLDTMRAFGDMTGGRAFVNTNDTRGAIHGAADDGAAYYLLSYAVDKSNRRPGWRKINVKAPNYTVRARPGYFMTQATADPALTAKLDVDTALTSPFEYTGLPMRVSLGPSSLAGEKRKVNFMMMMPPKAAQVDSANRNHLNVAIAYVVQTKDGKTAGQKGTSYNLNLDAAQLQQIENDGVGYGDTLELAPGDYNLRVVVRDNITGRMGSVTARLALK